VEVDLRDDVFQPVSSDDLVGLLRDIACINSINVHRPDLAASKESIPVPHPTSRTTASRKRMGFVTMKEA
jgi:hypothetical protein